MTSDADPFPVAEVPVEDVLPLRRKYLLPAGPHGSVEYKSDAEPSAAHFAVRDENGLVIAVASLCAENRIAGHAPHRMPGMRFRGLAVDTAWRGRGVARSLLNAMTRVATTAGMAEVWGNARSESIPMLTLHGFKVVSAEFEVPGLGKHHVVAREIKRPKAKKRKPSPKTKGASASGEESAD